MFFVFFFTSRNPKSSQRDGTDRSGLKLSLSEERSVCSGLKSLLVILCVLSAKRSVVCAIRLNNTVFDFRWNGRRL